MTWEKLLERLEAAGLNPVEVTYMENYGKLLSSAQKEFAGRQFRCTYGALTVGESRIEVLLFPSELHRNEFLEIAAPGPWLAATGSSDNAAFAFDNTDSEFIDRVLKAADVG